MTRAHGERGLLLEARRGDEGAARALWDALAPRMLAYAALLAGDAEAPDIAQTVFVRALRAPRRDVRRIDDVTGWLLRAARNEALNARRGAGRRRAREHAAAAAGADRRAGPVLPGADPDDGLRAALAALPSEQHEAVWLRHCAGLTFDQLACALDLPRSTAASRYRAGMRRLRETLTSQSQKEPSHA